MAGPPLSAGGFREWPGKSCFTPCWDFPAGPADPRLSFLAWQGQGGMHCGWGLGCAHGNDRPPRSAGRAAQAPGRFAPPFPEDLGLGSRSCLSLPLSVEH